MDQGLKERLIGAAVLVALAVWLIPWLLDGPDHPLPDDDEPLILPVPSGHVGEVRTEVIDLSPRRGDDASAAADSRAAAGVERRPEPPATQSAEPARSAETAGATPSAAAGAPSSSPAAVSEPRAGTASAAESGTSRTAAPETSSSAAASPEARTQAASPPPSSPPPSSSAGAARPAAAPAPSGDWAVQVGSFGDEENAQRLAQRISALGHSPRITTYRAGGRVMYRVRVGPHATREAAEAAASSLAARGFPAQVVTAE